MQFFPLCPSHANISLYSATLLMSTGKSLENRRWKSRSEKLLSQLVNVKPWRPSRLYDPAIPQCRTFKSMSNTFSGLLCCCRLCCQCSGAFLKSGLVAAVASASRLSAVCHQVSNEAERRSVSASASSSPHTKRLF